MWELHARRGLINKSLVVFRLKRWNSNLSGYHTRVSLGHEKYCTQFEMFIFLLSSPDVLPSSFIACRILSRLLWPLDGSSGAGCPLTSSPSQTAKQLFYFVWGHCYIKMLSFLEIIIKWYLEIVGLVWTLTYDARCIKRQVKMEKKKKDYGTLNPSQQSVTLWNLSDKRSSGYGSPPTEAFLVLQMRLIASISF